MANEEKKKGTFTPLRLPVAKKYVYPVSRKRMLYLGGCGVLIFAFYFVFNSLVQSNSFVSSGPLSSGHANLENDCSACHTKFASVTDETCSQCHEPDHTRAPVFGFAAHYLYRSGNVTRIQIATARYADRQTPCFACHTEHLGRKADITVVPDSRCQSCHEIGTFENDHPEFSFVKQPVSNEANLNFEHRMHVDLIKIERQIVDAEIEKTCAGCHVFESSGKRFQRINFDKHCQACHGAHRREMLSELLQPKNKCQGCHLISGRVVAPVQSDQRILWRAEFNHADHLQGASCLQCHNEIRMVDAMTEAVSPDESETQNIPKISNCRACHNSRSASNSCVTCHEFHPNKHLRFLRALEQN